MTPCRCSVCQGDRWAHRLIGFVVGLLVAHLLWSLILVSAASRSAVHPGAPVPSWADAGGRRTGAPHVADRPVRHGGERLKTRTMRPGGAPSPAGRTETSERLIPMPALWHHDPEVSFFGPGLYGRRTACGLALTTRLVGVAHRSLPCGTLIEFRWRGVTGIAPVVDRGPYVAGRTWDLTGGLCVALDHCWTGPIDWRRPR